jgi:hypothetical protein
MAVNLEPEAMNASRLERAAGSVAMACADRYPLATGGAATAEDRGPTLGLHAGAEAVGLRAAMPVGLKCALRH